MSDHSTPRNPSVPAKPTDANVKDLPTQSITAADAEAVKAGLGINRIVVTDGSIKAK